MPNEMIERVKNEIATIFAPAIDFKAPYAKVMLDMAAKAAIKAMREPTDQQRNNYFEMKKTVGENNYPFRDAEWEMMIDAALKE